MELLFKFRTIREVSLLANAPKSRRTIKRRTIVVVIKTQDGREHSKAKVDVLPVAAPVDHVFRFFEPEESFFTVVVPQLT